MYQVSNQDFEIPKQVDKWQSQVTGSSSRIMQTSPLNEEQSSGRFWDTDKTMNIYPMNSSSGGGESCRNNLSQGVAERTQGRKG